MMDNATRSERSRNAALEAALTVIARDGPARLTLDAIALESGISKGGVMHQFRSKEAVLKALLDRQTTYFKEFSRNYATEFGSKHSRPLLAAQIATLRHSITTPRSIVFAILAAAAQEPSLLSETREGEASDIEAVKAEAPDPDLAMLSWLAAWGLTLTTMLGFSPIAPEERERLFNRLLSDEPWQPTIPEGKKPRTRRVPARKKEG